MAEPELLAWCAKHGVEFGGIEAAYVSEGWRGIVATRALTPGEAVLRVPGRLLMTSRSARADPHLAAALARLAASPDPDDAAAAAALTPHQLLATHLLHEVSKGPDSFWYPYLKQLPRSYTSPAHFSADDVAALQLQLAQDVAAAAVERAKQEWRGALPLLQALGLPKRFTLLRSWLWAASTLHSRTMYLPWCPAGALTPFGDLHNYAPPPPPYVPQVGARSEASAALAPGGPGGTGPAPQLSDAASGAATSGADGQCVSSAGTGEAEGEGMATAAMVPQVDGAGGARAESPQACTGALGALELGAAALGSGQDSGSGLAAAGQGAAPSTCNVPSPADAPPQGAGAHDSEPAELRPAPGPAAGAPAPGAQDAEGAGGIAGDGAWDEGAQRYVITVRQPVAAGQQVLLCYGRHTNLELLEHYGFVMQDNPHDTAPLDPALLPVPDNARYSAGAPPLPPEECFVHAGGSGSDGGGAPSWALLHFLRYCAATPAERRTQGHLLAAGERINEQNDRIALGWLRAACLRQLADLPTTLEYDLRQLQQQKQHLREEEAEEEAEVEAAGKRKERQEGQGQATQEAAASEERVAVTAHGVDNGGGQSGEPASGEAAKQAAFSDGLTCRGLALQWRVCYKQALQQAVTRVDAVLGLSAAGAPSSGRSLAALLQLQRGRSQGGIPVSLEVMDLVVYSQQRQALLLEPRPPTANSSYDVLIVSVTGLGDASSVPGKLADLTYLSLGDDGWAKLPQAYKSSALYDNAVRAVPLLTFPFIMYYRLDIFRRDNLTVPTTWEQFTELAERYHKGPDGLNGACVLPVGCRSESVILRVILGAYVQAHGPSSGLLYDPASLAPLLDSQAGEQALTILRRLVAVGPTETAAPSCIAEYFTRGQCLLAVGDATRFKHSNVGSAANRVVRGNVGMALLPGSTRVLDRPSRRLVPCDAKRCPLATEQAPDPMDGVLRPLNRVIYVSSSVALVNGLSPPQYQFYGYQLFSMLATSDVFGELRYQANELLPLEPGLMSPDHAADWVARGYDPGDVARFLDVIGRSAASDNAAIDLRIRGVTTITAALLTAALSFTGPTAANESAAAALLPRILSDLDAALQGVVAAAGGPEVFGPIYRRAINYVQPTDDGGDSKPGSGTSGLGAPGGGGSSSQPAASTVALAAAIPCGFAVLLLLVFAPLVLWWRRRQQTRSPERRGAKGAAPGAHPATTLVGSTELWEHFPAELVDAALRVHHATLRSKLVRYDGYESSTEGDSFILGFYSCAEAVAFCLDAQQALLDAPWPAEVLRDEPAAEAARSGALAPRQPLRSASPGGWSNPARTVLMVHSPAPANVVGPGSAGSALGRGRALASLPSRRAQTQQHAQQEQQRQPDSRTVSLSGRRQFNVPSISGSLPLSISSRGSLQPQPLSPLRRQQLHNQHQQLHQQQQQQQQQLPAFPALPSQQLLMLPDGASPRDMRGLPPAHSAELRPSAGSAKSQPIPVKVLAAPPRMAGRAPASCMQSGGSGAQLAGSSGAFSPVRPRQLTGAGGTSDTAVYDSCSPAGGTLPSGVTGSFEADHVFLAMRDSSNDEASRHYGTVSIEQQQPRPPVDDTAPTDVRLGSAEAIISGPSTWQRRSQDRQMLNERGPRPQLSSGSAAAGPAAVGTAAYTHRLSVSTAPSSALSTVSGVSITLGQHTMYSLAGGTGQHGGGGSSSHAARSRLPSSRASATGVMSDQQRQQQQPTYLQPIRRASVAGASATGAVVSAAGGAAAAGSAHGFGRTSSDSSGSLLLPCPPSMSEQTSTSRRVLLEAYGSQGGTSVVSGGVAVGGGQHSLPLQPLLEDLDEACKYAASMVAGGGGEGGITAPEATASSGAPASSAPGDRGGGAVAARAAAQLLPGGIAVLGRQNHLPADASSGPPTPMLMRPITATAGGPRAAPLQSSPPHTSLHGSGPASMHTRFSRHSDRPPPRLASAAPHASATSSDAAHSRGRLPRFEFFAEPACSSGSTSGCDGPVSAVSRAAKSLVTSSRAARERDLQSAPVAGLEDVGCMGGNSVRLPEERETARDGVESNRIDEGDDVSMPESAVAVAVAAAVAHGSSAHGSGSRSRMLLNSSRHYSRPLGGIALLGSPRPWAAALRSGMAGRAELDISTHSVALQPGLAASQSGGPLSSPFSVSAGMVAATSVSAAVTVAGAGSGLSSRSCLTLGEVLSLQWRVVATESNSQQVMGGAVGSEVAAAAEFDTSDALAARAGSDRAAFAGLSSPLPYVGGGSHRPSDTGAAAGCVSSGPGTGLTVGGTTSDAGSNARCSDSGTVRTVSTTPMPMPTSPMPSSGPWRSIVANVSGAKPSLPSPDMTRARSHRLQSAFGAPTAAAAAAAAAAGEAATCSAAGSTFLSQPLPALLTAPAAAETIAATVSTRRGGATGRIAASAGPAGSGAAAAAAAAAAAVPRVMFRGLRVRMAVHTGGLSPCDVTRNPTSGRFQYGGAALRLARAVGDVASGGMILLSQAAQSALAEDRKSSERGAALARACSAAGGALLLMWMGRYCLHDYECPAAAATTATGAALQATATSQQLQAVAATPLWLQEPEQHLYQVVSRKLAGRLVLQLQASLVGCQARPHPHPLPGHEQQQRPLVVPQSVALRKASICWPLGGVLAAPLTGSGCLARLSVVGVSTLLAWNVDLTVAALGVLHEELLVGLRWLTAELEAAADAEAEAEAEAAAAALLQPALSGGTGTVISSGAGRAARARLSTLCVLEGATGLAGAHSATGSGGASAGGGGGMSARPLSPASRAVSEYLPSRSGSRRTLADDLGPVYHRQQPVDLPEQSLQDRQQGATEPGYASLAPSAEHIFVRQQPQPSPRTANALDYRGGGLGGGGLRLAATASFSSGSNKQPPPLSFLDRLRWRLGSLRRGLSGAPGGGAASFSVATGGAGAPAGVGTMTVVLDARALPLVTEWLLKTLALRLPDLDWPEELLEHPLAEEIMFEAPAAAAVASTAAVAGAGSSGAGGGSSACLGARCSSSVRFRGLRAAAAVVVGDLGGALQGGQLSGQLQYSGRGMAALKKVAAAAKAGQVVTNAETAALLPGELASQLCVKRLGVEKLKRAATAAAASH
ncbi:hypothetical protein HYH02_006149 [Chlamydomonas schloesseri]|uniref:Rubisco LSMT substrate-binding domain-containing protein n=1 Tax=Chlamydomonas schloesseri TaxID=2026947 RepID=A0A835WJH1_9CHLO|nr:hypothetical protein HYH02_006149 [Chlamydomonas schloesseri]|eukprot:KAG2448798.1 hypothetical protein HYH02_006149 [Chlamydomonas schloesseri]